MSRPGPVISVGLYRSPLGNFRVVTGGEKVLRTTLKQLGEYFMGRRKKFSVPLKIQGTDFQKKVWGEVVRIPYGKTFSYGELAGRLGRPKAARAVARAVASNKHLLFIPCHRVIASGGGLAGYSAGLARKKWLLYHEKK